MNGVLPARDGYARWAASYDQDRNPTRNLDAALL